MSLAVLFVLTLAAVTAAISVAWIVANLFMDWIERRAGQ